MKKTMFVFAAALMMVACSNEEVAVNDDVQYVSELKLNFGSGDSRIAATHNPASGLKFAWEDKDEIMVVQNKAGYSGGRFVLFPEESNGKIRMEGTTGGQYAECICCCETVVRYGNRIYKNQTDISGKILESGKCILWF